MQYGSLDLFDALTAHGVKGVHILPLLMLFVLEKLLNGTPDSPFKT